MNHFTYPVPGLSSENQKECGISFRLTPDQTQVEILIDPAALVSPLTRDLLLNSFRANGFEGFQLQEKALNELISQPLETTPITRIIATKQPRGEILIEISEDEMKAWMTLSPFPGSAPPSRQDILDRLEKAGVRSGLKEEIIERAVTQGYLPKSLVAEGIPPQKGKSAWFEYLLSAETGPQGPQVRADGSVNYRELNWIQTVEADTPLMRKHPPEPGIPGKKVTGAEIPAETGRDYHLSESAGSRISVQDRHLLIATRAGRPIRMSRSVKVDDFITLENVGFDTGNIDFKGSVVVNGSVQSGFLVRARGDIVICGSVEDAILESGGNIEIRGSVFGREQTSIHAKGDIRARFIQNASVECFGDLHVSDGLFYCAVRVMGNIFVGLDGGKGQINGGNIWGANSLKARILGSNASTVTTVSLGEDPYLRQKLKDIDHNLRYHKSELEQVIKSIIYIRTRAMEKASELAKLEEKRGELLETVNTLSEQISNLHESLQQSHSIAEVYVFEQLHSGVRLFFAERPYVVREDMGPSRLRIQESSEGSEVVWSPYAGR